MASSRTGLPARVGIGLKPAHAAALLDHQVGIGFIEVHAENYMGAGGPPHIHLTALRERYALSLHGVGLSIGGATPPDSAHLDRLARLVARYQPDAFSEHLAWSTHGPVFFNDLLPIVYDLPTLHRVTRHIDQVQQHLGLRMLLENPSTYVEFAASSWGEADFINEILLRTGCGLLLDVSNVVVSATNHGRDPLDYLAALRLDAAGEIHLAGYTEAADSYGARLLLDTHAAPVTSEVWELYRSVIMRCGKLPTLIEWDNNVPPLDVLLGEARRAETILAPEIQ